MLERLQLLANMCPWAVQLNVKAEKAVDDYGWSCALRCTGCVRHVEPDFASDVSFRCFNAPVDMRRITNRFLSLHYDVELPKRSTASIKTRFKLFFKQRQENAYRSPDGCDSAWAAAAAPYVGVSTILKS